jgi:FAD/FMN-containing dehydrogenase
MARSRETARNIAWARQTDDAMKPYSTPDRYVNYLDEDDAGDAVRGAYGPNFERLRSLKAKYDPANLFRLNQNIPPRR